MQRSDDDGERDRIVEVCGKTTLPSGVSIPRVYVFIAVRICAVKVG
jgi:hypothetical protein